MEAIQKAIVKARKNVSQEQINSHDHHPVKKKTSSAADKSDKKTVVDGIDDTKNILYKNTKVVAVKSEYLTQQRVLARDKNNPVAEIFKMLRTQVLLHMRQNDLKTLVVTGATEKIGKSMVASNLALSMALDTNQTIMLVDLDLKRPSISRYFGLDGSVEYGIGDYLLDDVSLDKILINPGIERLVILPGRKSYSNSSDIVSSQKMRDLIADLKHRYQSRIIIFDLPPVLSTDDALSLMSSFDASLFVIEDGVNTKDELKASKKILEKTELIGTVLNKGFIKQSSYYYSHH